MAMTLPETLVDIIAATTPVETIHSGPAASAIGGRFLTGLDDGATMLVMGGYGHNRFRQFVLGGVTRDMLEKMTIPTLMTH